MNVQEFQEKLNNLLALAKQNDRILTVQQLREELLHADLDQEQLLGVVHYLSGQGIRIQGLEEIPSAADPGDDKKDIPRTIPLAPEEKSYFEEYLKSLPPDMDPGEAETLFDLLSVGDQGAFEKLSSGYLRRAAQLAVDLRSEEVLLADLIQEANLSLVQILSSAGDQKRDEKWLMDGVRAGISEYLSSLKLQKTEDDSLVARVERLDRAVRELSDDEEGEGSAFSVNELAIILDMNVEEIRDTLRLTGEEG